MITYSLIGLAIFVLFMALTAKARHKDDFAVKVAIAMSVGIFWGPLFSMFIAIPIFFCVGWSVEYLIFKIDWKSWASYPREVYGRQQ